MKLLDRLIWRCPVCSSRTLQQHRHCRTCGASREDVPPFPAPEDLDADR